MEFTEELGLTRKEFEAVADRFRQGRHGDLTYYYLPDDLAGVPRGTVVIPTPTEARADSGGDERGADDRPRASDRETTVARGFPRISRTLVLASGVPRYFDGDEEFAVEEKLNGYNVRIVRAGGTILACTRGGHVCPFTTAKVTELLDLDPFFDAHPDAMLCGEMIGPENPYTTCAYPDVSSIAFRAFDIRHRETGEPVPVRERRALCDRYGIPQVPLLGYLAPGETDRLAALVDGLDAEGREGVVMKSGDGTRLLKYTTSSANRGNLAYAFAYPFDYGRDFVFPRLLREAFRTVEAGDDDRELAERATAVGDAIVRPLVETIRSVEDGAEIGERHTVRAAPPVVDALFDHFRDVGVKVRVESDATEGADRVVTFMKLYQSSTDKVRAYLDGQTFQE